jgi:hypothetical protein
MPYGPNQSSKNVGDYNLLTDFLCSSVASYIKPEHHVSASEAR